LSSNKLAYIIILLTLFLSACGKKEEKQGNTAPNVNTPGTQLSLNNPDSLKKYLYTALNGPSRFVYPGKFDTDSVMNEYAAGTEIQTKTESGIKFSLLKPGNNQLSLSFQTKLLKGSFTKSAQRVIRPAGYNYDMIYYSSLGYFMGAKFGEIFSYIIDFKNKEVYSAHLFTTDGSTFSIFLSENVKNQYVKEILLRPYLRDFSSALIVKKDVDLDNL
jgi:hypothetical protein